MMELIEANWPLVLLALLVGIAVAWLVFVANRRTKVETDKSDVLDEGRGPAARNQALIDSPPAARLGQSVKLAEDKPKTSAGNHPAPNTKKAEANDHGSSSDDLTRIKGVGPKLKNMLADLDITRFSQIAAWDDADIDRIDSQLGRFEGRIRRDNWVEQARLLNADDMDSYQQMFGKI